MLTKLQRAELRELVLAGPDPQIHGVVRWRCVDLQAEMDKLGALVWDTYDDILDACQSAWRFLINEPDRIRSIGTRQWASVSI